MRLSTRSCSAAVVLLGAAACAGVGDRLERDQRDLRATVALRAGVDVEPIEREQVDATLRELLAQPLDEHASVRIALLSNRSVRAAFASLGVASADVVAAGLLANPVLEARAAIFDDGEEIELALTKPFADVLSRSLRRRFADAELAHVRAAVAELLIGLCFDVRRGWVAVRASETLVAELRAGLEAETAAHDLMIELARAGNVTDADLAVAAVATSRAKLALHAAELARIEQREAFSALLGLWGESTAWTTAGELGVDPLSGLDLERIESRAIAASLGLAQSRAHAEALAQSAGLTRWEPWLASLELGVAAQSDADDGEWGFGPAASIPIPLFDTGATGRLRAQQELAAALERHGALAVDIRAAARTLRERALALATRATYLREQHLPLEAAALRETLKNYNAMQIGVFQVLAAKQREIDARSEHARTLRDAWRARYDLEELLAGRYDARRPAAPAPIDSPAQSAPMAQGH